MAAKKTAAEDAKTAFDVAKTAFEDSSGTPEEKAALKVTMDDALVVHDNTAKELQADEEEMGPLQHYKDRRDKQK